MKRTELKRLTPLVRKTRLQRHTRLNPMSKKRKKLMREVGPWRKEFLTDAQVCIVCRTAPAVELHEIANGAAREKCLSEPLLIMPVCRQCHDIAQNAPEADQMTTRILWEIDRQVELHAKLTNRRTVERDDVIQRLFLKNLPKMK